MKFRNVPPLAALTAAAITCIITIVYNYEATKALILILCSIILFYIIGSIVKGILNKFLPDPVEEEPSEEQEEEETEEEES